MEKEEETTILLHIGELAGELKRGFHNIDRRFDGVDAKFERLENRFNDHLLQAGARDVKIGTLEERMKEHEDNIIDRREIWKQAAGWIGAFISAVLVIATIATVVK